MQVGRGGALWFSLVVFLALTATAGLANAASRFEADSIRALIAARHYGPGENRARELVRDLEGASPLDSIRLGEALTLQTEAMWRGGRVGTAEAESVAARAVAVRERTLGHQHLDYAASLHNQANLMRIAGRLDGLDERYRRVLAIRVAKLGPEHLDVARTCNDYGNLRNLVGDYSGAESLYVRACSIYEKQIDTQRRNVAACLNNIALLAQARGDFARARMVQERCLELFTQALGPDHVNVGLACVNLARTLVALGEFDEARRLLERAYDIHVRALGPEHADVAWNLRELGSLNLRSGDLEAGRRTLERAVQIHERTLGASHTETALDLLQLAEIASSTGRDSEAVALYERALAINERVLGLHHPRTAQVLMGLGRLAAQRGDFAAARSLFERTFAIRRTALGEDHPLVAETERALGEVQWALGDTALAFESAVSAEANAREHLRLLQQTLPERLALSLAGTRITGLDLAIAVLLASPNDARAARVADAIIHSRAIVLDEMVQRARLAAESNEPGIDTLAHRLALARERFSNLSVRAQDREPTGRYRALRDSARVSCERAESDLAQASLGYRARQQERVAGLEQVRSAIPEGSALVSYLVVSRGSQRAPGVHGSVGGITSNGRAFYVACVIRTDGAAPHLVPLGAAAVVDSLASLAWKQLAGGAGTPAWRLQRAEREYRATGRALRRLIWDPLRPFIGASERVLVVPDGALSLIDFSALPDSIGYLIERGPTFHYLSAERVLASAPTGPATGRGLLAIGGPDFGLPVRARRGGARNGEVPHENTVRGAVASTDNPCTERLPEFEPLPRASAEARWVEDFWDRVDEGRNPTGAATWTRFDSSIVLTGRAATEDAFRHLAPGRRVLHLATHGFVLGDQCLDDGDVEPDARPPAHSATLGGLAFTGANLRSDSTAARDGVLTAEEIAGLELGGVEWTVLSACNTGLGEVRRGEGVFGLRRAFEVAGCRTLIMSLWPVADDSAREWMARLYQERFARGRTTADAVHQAGRSMLEWRRSRHESTHPWCWAGFIAAGDWR